MREVWILSLQVAGLGIIISTGIAVIITLIRTVLRKVLSRRSG